MNHFFYPINFLVANHELLGENKKIKEGREQIYKLENTAGGIDPETGYTRRVMIMMPWLVLTPPVEWQNLPDWGTFIAGRDATTVGRQRYLNTLSKNKKKNTRFPWYLVIILLTIFFTTIIAIFLLTRRLCKS